MTANPTRVYTGAERPTTAQTGDLWIIPVRTGADGSPEVNVTYIWAGGDWRETRPGQNPGEFSYAVVDPVLRGEIEATARKPRHVFRWVFLAVQALFVVWIITGAASTSGGCTGKTGDALTACQGGTAAGASIGIMLIVFLWAAVDVILGVGYLIFGRRSR